MRYHWESLPDDVRVLEGSEESLAKSGISIFSQSPSRDSKSMQYDALMGLSV